MGAERLVCLHTHPSESEETCDFIGSDICARFWSYENNSGQIPMQTYFRVYRALLGPYTAPRSFGPRQCPIPPLSPSQIEALVAK